MLLCADEGFSLNRWATYRFDLAQSYRRQNNSNKTGTDPTIKGGSGFFIESLATLPLRYSHPPTSNMYKIVSFNSIHSFEIIILLTYYLIFIRRFSPSSFWSPFLWLSSSLTIPSLRPPTPSTTSTGTLLPPRLPPSSLPTPR